MAVGLFVTSPVSGGNWKRNTTETITWNSTPRQVEGIKIELYKGGSLDTLITAVAIDNGSYDWAVPSGQAQGTDYSIKITAVGGTNTDEGAQFTIADTTTRTLTEGVRVFDAGADSAGVAGTAAHEIKTITRVLTESIELTESIFDLFDGNTFVYHIDNDAWTKFVGLDLQLGVVLSGGIADENLVLLLDAAGNVYSYPGTDFTSTNSQIRTKTVYMDKGHLMRMRVEYDGAIEPTLSCIVKSEFYTGGEKETVAGSISSDIYESIVEGGTRGKSFFIRVQNARIIHSIGYIYRKIGGRR